MKKLLFAPMIIVIFACSNATITPTLTINDLAATAILQTQAALPTETSTIAVNRRLQNSPQAAQLP